LYRGLEFDNRIRFDISRAIDKALGEMPLPEETPENAIGHLKSQRCLVGQSRIGGMQVISGGRTMTVRISARALLELLAGKLDQKEFFERHGFLPSVPDVPPRVNPFLVSVEKGRMIDSVSIEKSDAEDDDWITIELSKPDPAISPFVVPKV
jgi:hypothetical protein